MRIGIDIKALSNNSTGIARYLRETLDHLQLIDHENEYMLFECRESGYSLKNTNWIKKKTNWFFPGVIWQQLVLPFLLKKHSMDVFWAPEQICPVFFMKAIKIITTVHDCVAVHYPKTSQWSVKTIDKILFNRTLKKSHLIITVSDYIKKDLLSSYRAILSPDKIIVIPHGKPEWKSPGNYNENTRSEFLFFVGSNEPRKNLINLVKALEILLNNGHIVDLYIAGPQGWRNQKYFRHLQKSPVRNQIHFIGYCSDRKLQNEYMTCKAFIYPSLYEGFGLPVLEALYFDSIVLTSRGTVMEEIAGPAALYFNPEDPNDIARIIESIYLPNFSRNDTLKYKKDVLQKFSWEKSATQLLESFQQCFTTTGSSCRRQLSIPMK
jgi:glycosyltransferase involved in cell wall biosynthesis